MDSLSFSTVLFLGKRLQASVLGVLQFCIYSLCLVNKLYETCICSDSFLLQKSPSRPKLQQKTQTGQGLTVEVSICEPL